MKFTIVESKDNKEGTYPKWMIGKYESSPVENIYLFISDNECIGFEKNSGIKKYKTGPSDSYKPFHGKFTIDVE